MSGHKCSPDSGQHYSARCTQAVSYTHLDVYKRQGEHLVGVVVMMMVMAAAAVAVMVVMMLVLVVIIVAVSYTHLDVYKRQ